jgi:hypothetical protein
VTFRYFGLLALLDLPANVPAASREIQELQRDVAFLQEQVKVLQASQNQNSPRSRLRCSRPSTMPATR